MSATFLTTKKILKSRGVSLVETILYVVLLTLVMSVIVQMFVAIGGIYKGIKLTRELESSGTIAMESMLREVRNASVVVISESVLGTNPGTLTVSGVDENLNSYSTTFNVSSGVLQVSKNGGSPTALTSPLGTASILLFTRVASANSEGVRIELEISGISGSSSKSEKFYGFAVLRGSY